MSARRPLFLLAGLVLAAGSLAACGDDDNESTNATGAATATTAVSAAAAAPSTAATTAAAGGYGGDYGTMAPPSSAASAASAPAASAPAAAGAGASLALADASLGKIVVDGAGKTLYLFEKDGEGATTSACTGSCAETWPPLVTTGAPSAASGVDSDDLGTITRDDGTTQVTFYGHPLYYFAADNGPGQTNGQGIGGVWFVVGPDGVAIKG